jgi:hypothetical protein
MNTLEIVSFIKKYYLDGQCESAIWNQTDKGYSIDFYTLTKDCLGKIELNTELNDGETKFGVFNTSQLLSLMSITDEFCQLNLERDPKGNPIKLQISDNQFETFYHLADLNLFEAVPKIDEPESYDITIPLDQEFVARFIKARNALDKDINRVVISTLSTPEGEKSAEFTIGDSSSHANKIKFNTPAEYEGIPDELPFNVNIMKLIFQANKDFDFGEMKVFSQGLTKVTFTKGNINSLYFLVRLSA